MGILGEGQRPRCRTVFKYKALKKAEQANHILTDESANPNRYERYSNDVSVGCPLGIVVRFCIANDRYRLTTNNLKRAGSINPLDAETFPVERLSPASLRICSPDKKVLFPSAAVPNVSSRGLVVKKWLSNKFSVSIYAADYSAVGRKQ